MTKPSFPKKRPRRKAAATHAGCSKKRSVIKERLRAQQAAIDHCQAFMATNRAVIEDILQNLTRWKDRPSPFRRDEEE